jgi:serine/threonine protein phosphatase 1
MPRTYAVPDLHGRYDLLEAALGAIEHDAESGTVVFLGDYVDRGPQSRQVVERLIAGPPPAWRWICLKGNHEDMLVEALHTPLKRDLWLENGGTETVLSYGGMRQIPEVHVNWMASRPALHVDRYRIFVHAGLDPAAPIDEQSQRTLLWHRWQRDQDCQHPRGHIVHGHTPYRDGPVRLSGRTNLDCLAVMTGRLVIGLFDDDCPGGPIDLIEIVKAPIGGLW